MPALNPPRLHADRLRRPRLVLGLLLAFAVPGCGGLAWAQEARAAHRHYQLSAGPLDEALNRFARLAGITLSYAPDMVQGRTAPALDADLPVEDALAQLLAGSGLRAVRTPGGGYLRHPAPDSTEADEAPVLVVVNMTPVPRYHYRIGVPEGEGNQDEWQEILNTDSQAYGGSNVGNGGRLGTQQEPSHGQPASLLLTLPPLATLVLRRRSAR